MAGEWVDCVLADACSAIDYGLTASASDHDTGPRFLRITDIVSGHVDWNAVPHVTADAEITAKYRLDDGDVVLARTGASTGASAYVTNPPPAVFASYLVRLKAKPEFDSRFLAYYLKSEGFWTFIRGVLGDKSAQPNASASTMTKAPLRAPRDKNEQRAIAHILGTLDDKIELNRKMSETLEAMAWALFKSWFVDFDPVRAKMDGRDPGLPKEIADLFPSRMVESELGEIPEGWETQSLSALLVIIGGGTPKTSVTEYWDGDIPWFSVVDTPATGDVFIIATEKSITEQGLAGSSARLIPKGTAIISARGTVGNLAIAGREMTFNQSCYGLRGAEGVGDYFVYLTAQQMVDQLKSMAHGSVFSTITRQTFEAIQRPVPPAAILRAFERSVAAWFEAILSNVEESRTLAQLRDTLLSKLISGELRVPAAQTQIEEFLT